MLRMKKKLIHNFELTKTIKTLIIFQLCINSIFAQNQDSICFENANKEVWLDFSKKMQRLNTKITNETSGSIPHDKDSSDMILQEYKNNVADIALKYYHLPHGANRLFTARLNIPKESLRRVIDSVPATEENMAYIESLKYHLKHKQIQVGDRFFDFDGINILGDTISFSSVLNSNLLIIYGGLNCMGEAGRDLISALSKQYLESDLKIVVFDDLSENVSELLTSKAEYSNNYFWISDFKNDHSLMKIRYGLQTTPTFIIIDTNGKVVLKSESLKESDVNNLLDIARL